MSSQFRLRNISKMAAAQAKTIPTTTEQFMMPPVCFSRLGSPANIVENLFQLINSSISPNQQDSDQEIEQLLENNIKLIQEVGGEGGVSAEEYRKAILTLMKAHAQLIRAEEQNKKQAEANQQKLEQLEKKQSVVEKLKEQLLQQEVAENPSNIQDAEENQSTNFVKLKKVIPHLNDTTLPCFMLSNQQQPHFDKIFGKFMQPPAKPILAEESKQSIAPKSIFDTAISESFQVQTLKKIVSQNPSKSIQMEESKSISKRRGKSESGSEDEDVFPLLTKLNNREQVNLMGGLTEQALRTKLVEMLEKSVQTLFCYRVQSRLANIDGLYLKLEMGSILVRQAPVDKISDKKINSSTAVESIRVELEAADFLTTRLRYEGNI
ncbi:hypothetical protein FGO68_gene1470 [Halteria grandinella]|uniref:Uncharacterized protein n=1 Tax=Halteria grandinella TaxID=5974 RepID=A0A8J8NNH1_HALGN|nr:hypothetical protein FGO68_gene1470 [Halteria grandinella]